MLVESIGDLVAEVADDLYLRKWGAAGAEAPDMTRDAFQALATAAAFGVLTPGTCTPVTVAPWTPGAPPALTGNMPTLTQMSMCMCAYGGAITITNPGTTRTFVT